MLNHVANIDAGPWSSGFKTLSENDLDDISKKIIDTVSKKTGATIRS